MTTKQSAPSPEFQILKESTCPSLSEQSTLKYQIGTNPSGIQFRITENSGTGRFNSVWVPLADILPLLTEPPITIKTLAPIFKGKSVNTTGFLMAVLKKERLIQSTKENERRYEGVDPKAFMAEMEKLETPKPTKKGTLKNCHEETKSKQTTELVNDNN